MRNSRRLLALAACVLAVPAAQAETTAEQLTRIEAETAVLKARARKAEVQAQIAGKNAEIASRNAEARRASGGNHSSDGPQLRAIEGVGDKLFATVELPNRGLVDVRAGDRLADGTRIVAIRATEVEIETPGRRRVRLSGTNGAATSVDATAADMPLPMPATNASLAELPLPRGVRR